MGLPLTPTRPGGNGTNGVGSVMVAREIVALLVRVRTPSFSPVISKTFVVGTVTLFSS